MKKYIFPLAFLLLIGAGCSFITVNVTNQNPTSTPAADTSSTTPVGVTPTPQKLQTTLAYYLSGKESTDFCNGDKMDSVGYKNSLVKQVTKVVPGKLSTLDLIKATLVAAANDSDFASSGSYTRIEFTTFQNGVVTLHPAGGWAGSSIFMCAWQPFAQKQIEGIPGVKQIKWEVES